MPIPQDVVRVNIVWALPGNEIAVNSLHFQHEHIGGATLDWAGDMTQRYAQLVRDGIAAAWPTLGVVFSNSVRISRFDAYHLGTDGKTIDKKTVVAGATEFVGLSNQPPLPLEVALGVSLYAYEPNVYDPQGARKRGRIYMPGISSVRVNQDGRFTVAAAMVGWFNTFVGYVNNRQMNDSVAGQVDRAHLCVLSRRFGETHEVKAIRVDDLFDTQKRRQNALTPVAAIAPASKAA